MRRGTVSVGLKTRDRRGHEPIPLRGGREPLLAPGRECAGARPSWAGSGVGAARGAVDWPARRPTVGPASPPGALRMRKAGASEIQSPADLPGAQAEGHGGVPRVCGSRGLKPRAGRPLPEVLSGPLGGSSSQALAGRGVGSPRTLPAAQSAEVEPGETRPRVLRVGRGNLLRFLNRKSEPPDAPLFGQIAHLKARTSTDQAFLESLLNTRTGGYRDE